MISAYVNVQENREKLVADFQKPKLSKQKLFELAQATTEAYQEDLLAYNELLYFQENNKLLREHPIFDDEHLQEGINKMADVDALKEYKNLASRISKAKKKLKATDCPKTKRRLQKLQKKRELLKLKLDEK